MKHRLGRGVLILLLPALAGCSFLDLRPDRAAPEEFRTAFLAKQPPGPAQRGKRVQPPPGVAASLLPEFGPAAETSSSFGTGRRFNVSVMQADAREFFMGLVSDGDYNVIVHPDVKGSITVDLKNVTLPEVLDAVREVYGYDYKKTAAGYVIYPAELISRMFHMDYLNLVRNGRSETRVSAGQSSQLQRSGTGGQSGNLGSNTLSGFGGQQSMGQFGAGGGQVGEPEEPVESDCRAWRENAGANAGNGSGTSQTGRSGLPFIPGSVVATTSNSNFWRDLKQGLGIIVCAADNANFVVNQQSGVIVVHAYPKQLREVEQFLDAIRNEVQRQVVLEAKILEVVLSDGYQAGVNWANLIRAGENAALTSFAGPIPTIANTASKSFGQVFTIGANMGDFTALIELLETQGEVHTLSSPRIATLNNQKAVIKVGSDEFFVTDISNTVLAGAGATTNTPSVGLTPFFSGIALDVTPQIDESGRVTLHVHPSVTQVEDRVKRINVGSDELELPLAFSSVRESDSIVHAQNGQIVVIGGLMQNSETTNRQGAPWLSRIPGLGALFRRSQGDFKKSELVILLKPMVIRDQQDWNQVESPIAGRIDRLENESRQDPLP